MSQKRKEFIDKFRNKNTEFLTSPKAIISEQTKSTITNNEQYQVKHQVNDENDMNSNKVQFQIANKVNFTENVNHGGGDRVELKKPDNFSTFNNKYGNSESQLQQGKNLLSRFNTTVVQHNNNQGDASSVVSEPSQNYQPMLINGNKKYQPYKNIIKPFINTTSVVEIQQLPNSNLTLVNNGSRRPYSANTPLVTNDNHLMINPTNPSNIVYQNQIVQQVPRINTKLITFNGTSSTPPSPQRIFSADSGKQNMRYKKYINK